MNRIINYEIRLIYLVLSLLTATSSFALDTSQKRTINVATPGTLSSRLPQNEREYVVDLTLTGKLNGTDFNILRSMATSQKLQILDLSGANIVSGGASYYNSYGTNYYTKDNEFGYCLFDGCKKIEKVVLPNSLTTIGQCAFWYCTNLKTIVIGSKVTTIKPGLWGGCSKLTDVTINSANFHLTNGVLYNKDYTIIIAALQTWNYGDLSIRNGVKEIQYDAFSFCSNLTSLTFPSSVTTIGDTAFEYTGISSVVFTSYISSIGSFAFSGCKNLKELDLTPVKLTSLDYGAFMNSNIETVYMPKTLKELKQSVFSGTPLKNIFVYTATPATMYDLASSSPTFKNVDVSNCVVHVPQGKVNTYKTAAGWKDFYNITDSQETESEKDEAYAVYTTDGTLTFYYDNSKSSRTGTKYTIASKYSSDSMPTWSNNQSIKKVVFNSSFANYYPTSTAYWFFYLYELETITGTNYLKTNDVTDMYGMFSGCSSLTSLDLSSFNTSKVTSMNSMFWSCRSLTSLDLSSFNTSKVTNMSGMFGNCERLTSLDLSSFNTSNVTNMRDMFQGCWKLTSLNLSSFSTSKVTDMSCMFSNCKRLTSLNLSNFNTSKVTDMNHMFSGCSGLTSLDLSSLNTSNVTDMQDMFGDCSSLTCLNLSNFNTSKVTYMNLMFIRCSKLSSLNLSSFNTSNVTYMYNMFNGCSSLTSLDLSSFNTSMVTGMGGMFLNCTSLKTIYANSNWNTTNLNSSSVMFQNCTKLVGGAGTKYDANHVDKAYAHIDGGVSNPGYLTSKNAVPVEICSEDYLQQRLDEIAAQKPAEPVELTICPDGLTLTKSIHVDRDCKAIITGGPITSAASIEYRYGQEGLFMVYGELGFKDISLKLANDSKSDGCLGYFWVGNGKLQLGKGTSVVTTNGTVVDGWGDLEVTDAAIQAGGEDMVISDQINAAITEYVFLVGEKTYCNGKLSVDMKTDANTGSVMFPIFLVGQVNVSTSLDLWAPKNMLRQFYLHKDATINTYTDGFVDFQLDGEWEQMTPGRAFITSPSLTMEDYSRMTFSGMPTNRRTEFVANSHQVRLMSASQLSIQTQLAVLNNSSAAAAVTLNLPPEAVTVVNQSSTVNHKDVTFDGLQSGSGSRGRLHFADRQTLTITLGSCLTLKNIDVTGERTNNGFIVNGNIVLGENVHVSDLPCMLHVGSSGRVVLSAQPVSVITMEFIGGIADGQIIVVGTDDYRLQAADLEYIQVNGCELLLDETNNRIIAINATGVESIATDTEAKDGAGEYYDLSGRRVASPCQGTYILRKGGKTRKIFIK